MLIAKLKNYFLEEVGARKLASGAILALGIKILNAGLTFLMFLLLSKSMTVEEFGKLGFTISLVTFCSLITNLGLKTSIMKWVPAALVEKDYSKVRAYLFEGVRLSVSSPLVFMLLWILAVYLIWGFDADRTVIIAASTLLIPLTLTEFLSSSLRSVDRIGAALIPRDVFWRLAGVLIGGGALYFNIYLQSEFVLIFLATTLSAACLVQFIFLLKAMPKADGIYTKINVRDALKESTPMMGVGILFGVTQYADVILLGIWLPPDVVGPYFAAVRIANLLSLMLIASNMVAAPLISRYWVNKDLYGMQRMLRLLSFGITIPTAFLFLGYVFVGRELLNWFGHGFEKVYGPLLLLSAGFAFNALCGPTGFVMQMTGKSLQYLKIMTITYTLVIFGQIVLIPIAGVYAAALIGLVGQIVWNLWCRRAVMLDIGVDPTVFQFLGSRNKNEVG